MKLFDRSVDFAQFNEDPPLYALARAWMQNKPYGTKSSDSQEGNQDGDSPSNSQETGMSSAAHSVSIKNICCLFQWAAYYSFTQRNCGWTCNNIGHIIDKMAYLSQLMCSWVLYCRLSLTAPAFKLTARKIVFFLFFPQKTGQE